MIGCHGQDEVIKCLHFPTWCLFSLSFELLTPGGPGISSWDSLLESSMSVSWAADLLIPTHKSSDLPLVECWHGFCPSRYLKTIQDAPRFLIYGDSDNKRVLFVATKLWCNLLCSDRQIMPMAIASKLPEGRALYTLFTAMVPSSSNVPGTQQVLRKRYFSMKDRCYFKDPLTWECLAPTWSFSSIM